ncbi:MAG: Fe2+ transport system protein [Phenylobacterium sp.]|jgi:ferrous iron transport protein A|nr:Fe2+ transport system protein [Phenylobacterium sp.]
MHDMLAEPISASPADAADVDARLVRLSQAHPGDAGVIVDVRAESHPGDHGVGVEELQRRLLEFGFVEGAAIEVLHEGAIRRDPIAVRLDDMRVALRRRDAEDVWVLLERLSPKRQAR